MQGLVRVAPLRTVDHTRAAGKVQVWGIYREVKSAGVERFFFTMWPEP